jgi:hypothetical protein
MADQTQDAAAELASPRPLPTPQTGALGDDGAEALAQPTMGQTIAQNTIAAGQVNNGNPRAWAENAVAGVTAALAGFGAAGKVPPGAGALYGVGAAARQMQAQRAEQQKEKTAESQRQEQIDLEKQKVQNEQGNFDKEYQLHLAENARQQAQSIKELALDDANLRRINDSNADDNFRRMKEHTEFLQSQLDLEDAIKRAGGKDFELAGKPAPTFDDLGQMEQWAKDNKVAENMHSYGYRPRPYLGADGKYRIAEIPDDGVKEVTLKDADGKTFTTHLDALGVINYQLHVAQVREANARAQREQMDTKQLREAQKLEGTGKLARKHLDDVGGDYTKLSPGDREALQSDAVKRYQIDSTVYERAQNDFKKALDSGAIPLDKDGNPDANSQEYKDLNGFVEEARGQLHDTLTTLRQLGHGYQPYGQQTPAPAPAAAAATVQPESKNLPAEITTARGRLPMPKPPAPGTAITAQSFKPFLQAAGGDVEKAKEAAIAAGWGPPQVQ